MLNRNTCSGLSMWIEVMTFLWGLLCLLKGWSDVIWVRSAEQLQPLESIRKSWNDTQTEQRADPECHGSTSAFTVSCGSVGFIRRRQASCQGLSEAPDELRKIPLTWMKNARGNAKGKSSRVFSPETLLREAKEKKVKCVKRVKRASYFSE